MEINNGSRYNFIRIIVTSFLGIILVINSTFCSSAYAVQGIPVSENDCVQNVQVIKKDQVAPCDGFLFNQETEFTARQAFDDAKYYKSLSDQLQKKSDLQADENSVLEQRLKLYMDETHTLSQDVAKHDSTEGYIRFGYFILGVVATGLIVRNVRQ